MESNRKIKILIVDDHLVVREGLSAMLSRKSNIEVVGEAENGSQAIEKADKLGPDIVLMDLRMPEVDGVEAMQRIKHEHPEINFIVLTTYNNDEYIFKGIEAGARAYLLKDTPREELFRAIDAVSRGESLIEPAVAGRVLDKLVELSHQTPATELSRREIEVLELIAKGTGNKLIADTLSISESTVKTHIQSIFQKLEVNDRTEAVTKALSKGIIRL
ncbi:MAG TPA: response regulator transcription factor [Dehalococcoidia bacterium]|nr:response regulator transcription factor [Dehalococcoidia bacterium]